MGMGVGQGGNQDRAVVNPGHVQPGRAQRRRASYRDDVVAFGQDRAGRNEPIGIENRGGIMKDPRFHEEFMDRPINYRDQRGWVHYPDSEAQAALQRRKLAEREEPFMIRTTLLASVSVLGLAACVPQSQYDDLMNAFRSQEQQLLAAQSDLETSRANADTLRAQLAQAMEDLKSGLVDRDEINARLDKLLTDYNDLLNRPTAVGMLPSGMDSALRQLAEQFPQLLTYDPTRGMLRFNNDFTFDLGSAELKPQARQLIPTLAQIMNSSDASGLEAIVVGHTDNVPVSKPETQRLHRNNVGLSVHRSISVRDALVNGGVSPNRFMVAGFGEYRPIVQNQGSRGAAENRRVEIFFRPMPASGVLPAGGQSEPEKGGVPAKPVTQPEEPLK